MKPHSSPPSGQPPLQAVLIGANGFGRTHQILLRRMEAEKRLVWRDVIDPGLDDDPVLLAELKSERVRWHRSWEDFQALGWNPDCVFVAAPIHYHAEYARKVLPTGAYLYLEKPPVPLLSQMEELHSLPDADRRIQIGFSFPYSRQMAVLRQGIAEGRLGKIRSYRLVTCWPRADRYYRRAAWAGRLSLGDEPVFDGPATNALAHRLHDVLAIEAMGSGEICEPEELNAELYCARPLETYDLCSVRGRFPSGANFSIALSHACAQQTDSVLEIQGSHGWARIQGHDLVLRASFTPEVIRSDEEHLLVAFRHFVESARERKQPLVGLEETRPYVAMTNAMLFSSGDIHAIAPEHYEKIEGPEGLVYDVENINLLSDKVFAEGRNFSEVGAPWGVPGRKVSLADLSVRELDRFFCSLSRKRSTRLAEQEIPDSLDTLNLASVGSDS